MRRLSSDRVALVLQPHGVQATLHWRRWVRPLQHRAHQRSRGAALPDLMEAADAAIGELARVRPMAAAGLTVVVPDRYAPAMILDDGLDGLTDRQIELMAEVGLQERFGLESRTPEDLSWQILDRRRLFVTGLNAELRERIEGVAARHGLRLLSMTSRFAACWNQTANPFGRQDSGIFVCMERRHAMVAAVERGVIVEVSQGLLPERTQALEQRIAQDVAAWALEPRHDWTYAITGTDRAPQPHWKLFPCRVEVPA